MRSNNTIGKSVGMVLVVSMIGFGTAPSLPKAFADTTNLAETVSAASIAANTLSQLEIIKPDKTTLDQTLSEGTYKYTAVVDNTVKSISLKVQSGIESAIIKVNGQPVTDGTSSSISLNTGDNLIIVTVDDGVNQENTYTLTVTREKSSNNSLMGIQLSNGELLPKFNASIASYHLVNAADTLAVLPIAADKSAGITVNGIPVTNKGVSVKTPVGNTKITIIVSAENGDTETYTIEVAREGQKVVTQPGATGKTAPDRSPANKYGSKGSTGFNVKNNSASNLKSKSTTSMNSSSAASWSQSSLQGAGTVQKPSTATLSSLSVSAGSWNKTFTKDTYTYHIAVGSNVDSVTFKYASTYSGASVTFNNGGSNAIQLGNQKKSIIPITVTNGSDRKTYVIVFDKKIPQPVTTTSMTTAADTSANSANVDSTSADTSYYRSSNAANNWTNQQNSTSASWWSRLLNSIKSFFQNL